ncbi:hypothetical protein CIK77_14290 [Microbacterium sp. JB110]|nr:hypothetical protein CIK77_14290 [Microbacterium sp. JB110]
MASHYFLPTTETKIAGEGAMEGCHGAVRTLDRDLVPASGEMTTEKLTNWVDHLRYADVLESVARLKANMTCRTAPGRRAT